VTQPRGVTIRRSLRVRLTAAFLLFAGAAIAAAAVAALLLVEQATLGRLDAQMAEEAATLAALVDLPSERLLDTVREIGGESDMGPGKFVAVLDQHGAPLAASRKVPASVAERRPLHLDGARISTVRDQHATFRVAWAPTRPGGSVVVGSPATREFRLVQHTRWVISLLAAGLLAMLGGAAWGISGRATQELARLAEEVATIEAGSLERRLSVRRTDEVDRLVSVLNRVLERLERSVGQLRRFTADAAHELRTPISAMRARLEVALMRDEGDVPRDVVVDVLEQTERLGRLAEDLLMLARVEGGALQSTVMDATVNLSTLVEEVATALVPIAEEQSRPFRWQAAPDLVVRGSEPLLKRVLINLVDNAFRHTPSSAGVQLSARREGPLAVIEVRDHGPGIDPAMKAHLFERFRHGAHGGSGLGLALVREIVDRHRGTVTVEGRDGRGTSARVTLALASLATVPTASPP
jgi:signal transduction histidine kinase